ncbi:myb family transcription factor EFM-like [Cucurbita pepo subsp. pepo]|uniref:myb family transcription factor EFM-like n=1 Tax=Cucurbita pepo subsp. pepo TaxID=3664 RepID=UPI000C9D8607|nr:myb family transcription factor EFM-like [Cucurbita pepo subsp. pepo]
MPSPPELSLDCKPNSYSMLLKSFVSDQVAMPSQDHTQKQLEDLLSRLEGERLKIDAFKRELPLCMQLLTNALESSRQQLQACKGNNIHQNGSKPVLEEFIPLKQSTPEGQETISSISDKANWMISAQLWSQTTNDETKPNLSSSKDAIIDHQIGFIPKLQRNNNNNSNNGGAFHPFSKDRILSNTQNSNSSQLPDLALAAGCGGDRKEIDENKCVDNSDHHQPENVNLVAGKVNLVGDGQITTSNVSSTVANNNTNNSTNHTHRKARRCWSPDLHRRFVNALQMLGGSQVATPKQIRELMKVDGLTNDEVKSHLQKYRLHTRRPSPSPQAAGAPAPQLVVLGGIWVPPEYATAAAAAAHGGAPALYAPHPTSYCAPPVHQDFYPPPPPLPHHQLHHQHALHQQLNMYKAAAAAAAQAQSSPQSEGQGNGGRSESIEDGGKSDSGSWKAESGGENNGGGERKGNLAALRQEAGEESNGSEITLKF